MILDYSEPQSVDTLVALGVTHVLRYVAPIDYGWPKALSCAEKEALESHGIGIIPVWEGGRHNWVGGTTQGQRDGAAAMLALTQLGIDSGHLAVAFDSAGAGEPPNAATVTDYWLAFIGNFPPAIICFPYGCTALIATLSRCGAPGGWEAAATAWPSDDTAVVWLRQGGQSPLPGTDLDTPLPGSPWIAPAPEPVPEPAPAPDPTPTPTPEVTVTVTLQLPRLQAGSEGTAVRRVQALCVAAGQSLALDGVFGPLTADAVRAVQATHGLVQDAIVGPLTWGALLS